ncbi:MULTISPECIES: 5'-methylthioadenosine/S-adenosylhomocysteine nucleosidase [unclassified Ochrobactrum]|uniref:5'-methylthioadenosine/S-adenosylhomocysteine nucleosidase n=1 Tax=unclassified Ochrobactrum TaxID=239106 RepID=UPI000DEF7E89|nr:MULTISPECIES: 5'-methylthioadenosine/S-adenosylhomocysteine nucleosidase [unclassified Ochrobactrum]MBQ0710008.1 5'-methylthioadenosine/S-adenosylhomocysteine nucleosidase [Ochrobactrum sp. AP1BH01-1]
MIKTVAGKRLLYVMAVDAEYGRHLAKLFTPVMIGVGPVEAAANLAYALGSLIHAGEKPDLVVSLGSAGSARLPQAEVFQVSSVCYRDIDASPLGFEKGATPFLDIPKVIELPISVPEIPAATLSTGANIVSGEAYTTIDADMVDMETYACLRACQLAEVPLFGLRGISDGANELQHVGDWTQYLHIIDEKLAVAVERLETAIADGLICS